jgi:hypothetical protein
MNAFKHNLSGQHLVLVENEFNAYHSACERGLCDLAPKTEPERQIAQKIIDINFRLNRITALETNMFNLDTWLHSTSAHPEDDRLETMCAQTRAWKEDARSFELLGRYEARLSRQLLQYQKELERLQAIRKAEEARSAVAQPVTEPLVARAASANSFVNQALSSEAPQPAQLTPEMASFGTPANSELRLPSISGNSPSLLPPEAVAA